MIITTARRYSTTWLTIFWLLAISLFPLWIASQHIHSLNDDAYITLAYAKNLATGKGFVFNHPPATLGTTTPLFTLIIAGLGALLSGVDVEVIAVYFTALCWIGTIWVFFCFRHTWHLQNWQAGVLGGVIVTMVWLSSLGMETYLFTFLLVLCLSLFFSSHHGLAGCSAGLLFLTRGEGLLILCLLLVLALWQEWLRNRSINPRLLGPVFNLGLGFTLPLMIWFIYAQLTFGAVLPNTLTAKQAQGQTGQWKSFWDELINTWLPSWEKRYAVAYPLSVNVWWPFVSLGIGSAMFKRHRWLAFLAWISLYSAGYTLLGVSAYSWYQLPIVFVLNLFFGLGVIQSLEWLLTRLRTRQFAVSLSLALVIVVGIGLIRPALAATLSYRGDLRSTSYAELTQWIRANTKTSDCIAFIEIGYLGYYTDNCIIDLAGLTLPSIVPHIAQGDFAWGFWHYRPDYYLYLPDFDWALAGIRSTPDFDRSYRPVATLPGPRETDFVVYRRIDAP